MRPARIFSILLLSLLLSAAHLYADQAGMEQCNSLYHNGEYTQAVTCYKDISKGNYSSSILFNLGNCYAQTGEIGTAILYYQRALCLAPGDPDIEGNLSLVQNEEGLFAPEPSLVKTLANLCTISQWAILALTALFAYLCFAIYRLKFGQRAPSEALVILCCATIFCLGVFGTAVKFERWKKSVIISDSKILISPYENAAQAGTIKPGRLVSVQKHHGNFSYILDETGRKGWVIQENIVPILPSL